MEATPQSRTMFVDDVVADIGQGLVQLLLISHPP